MMKNKLLTAEEAAQGLAKIVRENIKDMKRDGLSHKDIQDILDAIFAPLACSPH